MSYIGYNKRSGGSAKLRMEVVDGVIEEVDLKDVVFSNGSFQIPDYEQDGLPVNYNFIFGGLNWSSPEECQQSLRDEIPSLFSNVECNALKNLNDGNQQVSLHFISRNELRAGDFYNNYRNILTSFYDLKGYFKNIVGNNVFNGLALKVISLPAITALPDLSLISYSGAHVGMPNLEHFNAPLLASIGPTDLDDDYLKYAPNYIALTVSKTLETSNNGGIEGDLQWLIDNKFANITFV